MSNELDIIKKDMEFMDLQNIINQAISAQNMQLNKEIAELRDEQAKTSEDLSIFKEEQESLKEIELKRHRVEEHRYGFVSQNDLGQCYDVSIGSKTIGKLLKLVGLAKQKQSKTEPMRSAVVESYAKSIMYGDFPSYQWSPDKCIKRIDYWLNKEGVIDKFYAIDDEKELAQFINDLCDIYGI